jgi:predicted HD phosphohydrolase
VELRRTGPPAEPADVTAPASDGPLTADRLSTDLLRTDDENRATYAVEARGVVERHARQTREDVELLRKRYAEPLFGRVRVWELVERLGACVDPSDERLYCASQLVHVRQILDQMEADGTASPPMVLVALVHDLGKLLLLTGEDPANVVCMNSPVGDNPEAAGLDHAVVQWNHDELAFQRLDGLIPDDLAWLIRYHSLEVDDARHLMDASDLERVDRLLRPFAHYDHATKSPYHLPTTPLSHYRDVIEEAFPDPILF